jgi:hypothetical protein
VTVWDLDPGAGFEPASRRSARRILPLDDPGAMSPVFALRATTGSLREPRLGCRPKRLGAKAGPPSRIRTCGLRLRKPALCSAELWVDLALPAGFEPAVAGLRDRSPWPLDDGSVCHDGARLRPAGYDGQPSRGEAGLPAEVPRRKGWLPSQESNLPQLCLTGSRVHLARLRGMEMACQPKRLATRPPSPKLRRTASRLDHIPVRRTGM